MFEFDVDEFHVTKGDNDEVRIQIESMSGEAGLDCLHGLIDDAVLEVEDVLETLVDHNKEAVLEYVLNNTETGEILDNIDNGDILDYALTDASSGGRALTRILNAIIEETSIEMVEKEVLRLKKQIAKKAGK